MRSLVAQETRRTFKTSKDDKIRSPLCLFSFTKPIRSGESGELRAVTRSQTFARARRQAKHSRHTFGRRLSPLLPPPPPPPPIVATAIARLNQRLQVKSALAWRRTKSLQAGSIPTNAAKTKSKNKKWPSNIFLPIFLRPRCGEILVIVIIYVTSMALLLWSYESIRPVLNNEKYPLITDQPNYTFVS